MIISSLIGLSIDIAGIATSATTGAGCLGCLGFAAGFGSLPNLTLVNCPYGP